jgi:hypothetical protein
MNDRAPWDPEDERRLRATLERLAARPPRAFDPPPRMLRRAHHRVAATAVGVLLVVSAFTAGGVALARSLAERSRPPVPIESPHSTGGPISPPCTFTGLSLPTLPAGRDGLVEVTGTSPDDVWIGGGRFNADFSKPEHTMSLMLHWDGESMRLLPPRKDVSGVNSIDALAPDDVWAATESGPWHWNGSSWSVVGTTVAPATTLAISASGPGDVWAVGGTVTATAPFVEHFDGTGWAEVPTPADLHLPASGPMRVGLNAVVARGPDDAWAVGGYFFEGDGTERPEAPVVLHWDGARWNVVDLPAPNDAVYVAYGVAATGPDDVWVVAQATGGGSETTPGLVLHWDGSTWSRATPASEPGTVLRVQTVDAAGPDDVWIGGAAVDASSGVERPVVEHFDGGAWTVVPLVERDGGSSTVVSVRVIGSEVWAVEVAGLGRALEHPPSVSVCR